MVTSVPRSVPHSPHYSILGRISDTNIYRDVAEYQMVTARRGGRRAALAMGQGEQLEAPPGADAAEMSGGVFRGREIRGEGGSIPGVAPCPFAPRHRRSRG